MAAILLKMARYPEGKGHIRAAYCHTCWRPGANLRPTNQPTNLPEIPEGMTRWTVHTTLVPNHPFAAWLGDLVLSRRSFGKEAKDPENPNL